MRTRISSLRCNWLLFDGEMPKRKKGQRFRGTYRWEKKRSSGEHDNPVASTAASERLGDDDSDSENERDIPQTCEETAREDPGYRLVHLSSMKQAFEKNLPSAQMILVEDEGKRFGQSSVFPIQSDLDFGLEVPVTLSIFLT